MKITKKTYIEELGKIKNNVYSGFGSRSEICLGINKIYSENLEGRHFIPAKTTLPVLEKLYEQVINFLSDNHIAV